MDSFAKSISDQVQVKPQESAPKFSFIISTKGNSLIVDRLLKSLQFVRHSFEVIIIEQNLPAVLSSSYLSQFNFDIRYFHIPGTGLSRGRNLGLAQAKGDLISFLDDDGWLLPNTTEAVIDIFNKHPSLDFLSGQVVDDSGETYGRWLSEPCAITKQTIFGAVMEHALFFRRQSLEKMTFNEQLGLGAGTVWGSCDGIELVCRLIDAGRNGQYFPSLKIGHPSKDKCLEEASVDRIYLYNRAIGFVLMSGNFPIQVKLRLIIRPLVASCLFLPIRPRRSYAYWCSLKSRLMGMRDAAQQHKLFFLKAPLNNE